jgi:hypothetical protein
VIQARLQNSYLNATRYLTYGHPTTLTALKTPLHPTRLKLNMNPNINKIQILVTDIMSAQPLNI